MYKGDEMSSGMTIYELMHRAFLFLGSKECDGVSRENSRAESKY
jgi:hypothetical protein